MAPELNAWTEMAARAFGSYSGINEAIKKLRPIGGPVTDHASEIRQQMIMIALIRSFAVMDRDSKVSFQAVYRFLKLPDALDLVTTCYANREPKGTFENSFAECKMAMSKFIEAYKTVDFEGLGRLQSFRNSTIAHIAMPDIEKAKVTYTDVEKLIRANCEMAGRLTLMLSGGNDWPAEHLEDAHSTAYAFWTKAIEAQ